MCPKRWRFLFSLKLSRKLEVGSYNSGVEVQASREEPGRTDFTFTFKAWHWRSRAVPDARVAAAADQTRRLDERGRRRLMMALTWLLLLELALYSSCFVCGIVAAASITIVQGNFGGLCMLYGLVNYNTSAGLIQIQSSSSPSLCYFVSAISVLVAVVCFSLSLYWVYTLCMEGDVRRERVWMNMIVVVCGVFLFFLLITGCMLKIGRDSLCTSVLEAVPNITSCEEAQTRNWVSPLRGGRFYNSLHKAETAVWVNFFFWIIIGLLVFFQRRQSSGTKTIIGGLGGPSGGLFADPGVTAAETEPFFNRPPRPQ